MIEQPRRAAVLGSPIGHSLSPVLHRAAYSSLGLDWRYDALDVREDELAEFLDKRGSVDVLCGMLESAERAHSAGCCEGESPKKP